MEGPFRRFLERTATLDRFSDLARIRSPIFQSRCSQRLAGLQSSDRWLRRPLRWFSLDGSVFSSDG